MSSEVFKMAFISLIILENLHGYATTEQTFKHTWSSFFIDEKVTFGSKKGC